eukprot:TRINITY_DN1977_c0_g2_i1.p1 TRINITY_DN1977_c0_g2~~TRINITY_DN1977_c0_g2_i1.p1  ORF type:complete len:661 (+),score=86.16 TRINITY_DN1977_c0_g2_i1:110-1984(+)
MSGRGRGGGRGRGKYYKQRYGGGRSRQPRFNDFEDGSENAGFNQDNDLGNAHQLRHQLRKIDGRQYGAYKDLYGDWQFNDFLLKADQIQGDAYASPSRFRIQVPHRIVNIPAEYWNSKIRRIALADFLTRTFGLAVSRAGGDIRRDGGGFHGAKGGDMTIDLPGQNVIERTSVLITEQYVEARFTIGLPASGRTILGDWAEKILCDNLPQYVRKGLYYPSLNQEALIQQILSVEDQEFLRNSLSGMGLCAFIGNDSILPRMSGDCDEPLSRDQAVPFMSPPSMLVEIELPNHGKVQGMGIQKGITLIVGGGFHGKSTLLEAIEVGVYNKIPGDGRELVVCDPTSTKIRAEDGRQVTGVDISAFIGQLPHGKSTNNFSTPDASGSTSQAANIMEALEIGSSLLLLDEDTCATNFMIRDARMSALVSPDMEPITPFISKILPLKNQQQVSSILVIGGSGDYFDTADTIICMQEFRPVDVTAQAKYIAQQFPGCPINATDNFGNITKRIPVVITGDGQHDYYKIRCPNVYQVQFGHLEIDLNCVEQLVERSQTRAVADSILWMLKHIQRVQGKTIQEIIQFLEEQFDERGMDVLAPGYHFGWYARPRKFEIVAALNRIRTLQVNQVT